MINNQVKPYVCQMHLFYHIIKLRPCQNLEGIPINIQYPITLNLGVSTLHQTLISIILTRRSLSINPILLNIQPLSLALPLLLNDFDHSVLLRLSFGSGVTGLSGRDSVFRDEAELRLGEGGREGC